MITFWIFAIAMVIIALGFLLQPFRPDLNQNDIDRTTLNVDITKERLNELKSEFEQGIISQTEYEQTRQELELSLLNDVEQRPLENLNRVKNQFYNRVTRFALLFTVPVFAISLYAYLGQPELLGGTKKQTAIAAGHASSNGKSELETVEQMIEKLAARLQEQPNNAEGWFMLGRSYMSLKKYKEAVAALEKTNQLVPNNPVIMLRYADALTMLRGGQISGKPFDLIKRAVEIKPDDPTGLWLLGMGYEEKGEYRKAISYWTLLLPLLKDEKSINEVNNLIRQAKRKSGDNLAANLKSEVITAEKKSIPHLKVNVHIDKDMLKDVSMNDVVFIFAKAANGSPMPLAVVRKQVKDLPLEVILDDTMAMTPTMKLSSFKKVQVSARISKSGSAIAQSGDLQSEIRVVSTAQKEKIELTINKFLP